MPPSRGTCLSPRRGKPQSTATTHGWAAGPHRRWALIEVEAPQVDRPGGRAPAAHPPGGSGPGSTPGSGGNDETRTGPRVGQSRSRAPRTGTQRRGPRRETQGPHTAATPPRCAAGAPHRGTPTPRGTTDRSPAPQPQAKPTAARSPGTAPRGPSPHVGGHLTAHAPRRRETPRRTPGPPAKANPRQAEPTEPFTRAKPSPTAAGRVFWGVWGEVAAFGGRLGWGRLGRPARARGLSVCCCPGTWLSWWVRVRRGVGWFVPWLGTNPEQVGVVVVGWSGSGWSAWLVGRVGSLRRSGRGPVSGPLVGITGFPEFSRVRPAGTGGGPYVRDARPGAAGIPVGRTGSPPSSSGRDPAAAHVPGSGCPVWGRGWRPRRGHPSRGRPPQPSVAAPSHTQARAPPHRRRHRRRLGPPPRSGPGAACPHPQFPAAGGARNPVVGRGALRRSPLGLPRRGGDAPPPDLRPVASAPHREPGPGRADAPVCGLGSARLVVPDHPVPRPATGTVNPSGDPERETNPSPGPGPGTGPGTGPGGPRTAARRHRRRTRASRSPRTGLSRSPRSPSRRPRSGDDQDSDPGSDQGRNRTQAWGPHRRPQARRPPDRRRNARRQTRRRRTPTPAPGSTHNDSQRLGVHAEEPTTTAPTTENQHPTRRDQTSQGSTPKTPTRPPPHTRKDTPRAPKALTQNLRNPRNPRNPNGGHASTREHPSATPTTTPLSHWLSPQGSTPKTPPSTRPTNTPQAEPPHGDQTPRGPHRRPQAPDPHRGPPAAHRQPTGGPPAATPRGTKTHHHAPTTPVTHGLHPHPLYDRTRAHHPARPHTHTPQDSPTTTQRGPNPHTTPTPETRGNGPGPSPPSKGSERSEQPQRAGTRGPGPSPLTPTGRAAPVRSMTSRMVRDSQGTPETPSRAPRSHSVDLEPARTPPRPADRHTHANRVVRPSAHFQIGRSGSETPPTAASEPTIRMRAPTGSPGRSCPGIGGPSEPTPPRGAGAPAPTRGQRTLHLAAPGPLPPHQASQSFHRSLTFGCFWCFWCFQTFSNPAAPPHPVRPRRRHPRQRQCQRHLHFWCFQNYRQYLPCPLCPFRGPRRHIGVIRQRLWGGAPSLLHLPRPPRRASGGSPAFLEIPEVPA